MQSNSSWVPRRQFLQDVAAATAGLALSPSLPGADANNSATAPRTGEVPRRKVGATGESVSIIGVGGHTMALASDEEESIRIVHEAIDAGINFMDNCWDYHQGRSETIMGKALKDRRDKVLLMTKVCAHIRGQTKQACMEMLEESLKRLQTDRLDLWMLHELTTMDQVEAAWKPGGPIEALTEAKKQGKVRYVGFTGHQSAEIHLAMLKHNYPFDAVLMPVNAFEANRKGFRAEVLPELTKRKMGVLGIKSLGGTPARILREGKFTATQLLRFSLSHPVATQIVGMRSLQNLRDNLEIARNFTPMPQEEMDKLVAQVSSLPAHEYVDYHYPHYRDGRGIVA
jgi:aryl-alcohol dehydrogenase-like predicted oxidoreductase